MKCVVTGGAGFIGSHLCDALIRRGDEVVCLDNFFTGSRANVAHLMDNHRFEIVRHDVCEPWHIECDELYHLACPASPVHYQHNPARTIDTAVIGTRNALAAARDAGGHPRLLVASTSEVYGDPAEHPQRESYWGNVNSVGPRACYDEGKRAGEALCVAWAAQYLVDVRIARIFNTYGPRMARGDGRLIPNFITQALADRPLTVYGDGSQTRSFCYVTDTVDALLRLMAPNVPAAFDDGGATRRVPIVNVGNPDERSVLSVAQDIVKTFGGDPTSIHADNGQVCLSCGYGGCNTACGRRDFGPPRAISLHLLPSDDPRQRCPDITRARTILGWAPTTTYADGIAKTIDWFRKSTPATA